MISNFHTHTELCKHAYGQPIDYVLKAKEDGCSALGFSDHCPYLGDATWLGSRMTVAQAPNYIKSVRKAALEANFPVYAGFECEWAPQYDSWYRDYLLGELQSDYLAYGAHWVYDDKSSVWIYAPEVTDKNLIKPYTELTIKGIASGLFSFIAHPDLLMAGEFGWNDETKACLCAIMDAAIDCNLPMEVNGLGLYRKYQFNRGPQGYYPMDNFWELVAKKNVPVICNSDAHMSENVLAYAKNAREYAARFGLTIIENPLTIQK